ncbi:6-hydroxymethylpterin diphosphokinase MptE-like protein [Methanosphaera sp. WGK6]|uniref:6-hydroxymethylpterin diphosphokinase MptE-like protein n=1 Tax=Methanosphaera sp. WGK6 TaxID=1561964 RepID=UPI00084C0571|nr:6-hydroxymethylpterin diphosphokinase MptE-like protein [Methanosphaera sp. WGK6]OED29531.1 6-hydroxymethyl-7,8-dihydropterin pyrophosphokinase [Methanosphaera sp. WGK6]
MKYRTYNNWDKWYDLICDDFNFNKKNDEYAADFLNNMIMKKGKHDITHHYLPDKCIVFGAGPSIKKHIQLIKQEFNLKDYTLIAADGATEALLEENIIPTIIATDLDGNINSIQESNKKGSILYVHAHGDNLDNLKKYVPLLENIIPTTQSKPKELLENYGGFTDGDRAVHIAVYALAMKEIIMAGMDFGDIITRYSRPEINSQVGKADDFKKLKLSYAEKLINSLKKENFQVKFINLLDYTNNH